MAEGSEEGVDEGTHSLEELAEIVADDGDEDREDDDRLADLPDLRGLTEQDVENWIVWRANAPLLYDLFVGVPMEWAALCAEWLPDEPGESCRLAIGTHTDGSVPSEIVIVELNCAVDSSIDAASPWRSWSVPGLGDAEGFGCDALDERGVLRPVARLSHPTEVNRIAVCPQRSQLIASKAATGAVLLFDYKAERPAGEVRPDASLTARGQAADGFALGWSPLESHLLSSGGNDGHLCVWDVQVVPTAQGTPLQEFSAHRGALCDLSFSRVAPSVIATVGDDCHLRTWDTRAANGSQLAFRAAEEEVLAVDWSYHQECTLATSGKDGLVKLWDLRSPGAPTAQLRGHRGDVVAVRWAPFRPGLLASCGNDARVLMWDLQRRQEEGQPDEEPPELLLAHGGHGQGVSDFSWSHTDEYLVCSVSEDHLLHIWQPSAGLYLEGSDGEENEQAEEEPASKRPRT